MHTLHANEARERCACDRGDAPAAKRVTHLRPNCRHFQLHLQLGTQLATRRVMRYLIAILAIAGFVEVTAAAMRAHGAETSSSIYVPAWRR